MSGAGNLDYAGSLFVRWPPLYPVALATIGSAFCIDPLEAANYLNAVVFGLIVFFGGLLLFEWFPNPRAFAFIGTSAILFSPPLLDASIMVWTEPLFILWVLFSFLFAEKYINKGELTSLVILSLMVALALLTRFVGVALFFWGLIIILSNQRENLKRKKWHALYFAVISWLPIAFVLINNYFASNSFVGKRGASNYSFIQNISFTIDTLNSWLVPPQVVNHPVAILLLPSMIIFLIVFGRKINWRDIVSQAPQINLAVLFSTLYTILLISSSTIFAYDKINNRLLSPIYVPMIIIAFFPYQVLKESMMRRDSKKWIRTFLMTILLLWFFYPFVGTVYTALYFYQNGRGYASQKWLQSETIQYLDHALATETACAIYSNAPDVIYLRSHSTAQWVPAKSQYDLARNIEIANNLRGSRPLEDISCLVLFNEIDRDFLFTGEELENIVEFETIAQFSDGAIYSMSKK
ncbi:MAG: hypothetical protein DWG76_04095 [Chloroflexi bacterium]|nr:hypothetical protein [Chloroflexota bacterium]